MRDTHRSRISGNNCTILRQLYHLRFLADTVQHRPVMRFCVSPNETEDVRIKDTVGTVSLKASKILSAQYL
jgi:hypothetical protein